jgi:prepilin peptidase CpaA
MTTATSIALWPTAAVVLAAAFIDIRTHTIPNRLVVPFFLAGLAVSGVMRGWAGIGQSFLGTLTAAMALGLFCYMGGMGLGDLKLFAAIGAWIGPSQVFMALLLTGMAGAAFALCWAIIGGFLGKTLLGVGSLATGFITKGFKPHETLVLTNPLARRMPYAPAIAVGTLLSFLGTR